MTYLDKGLQIEQEPKVVTPIKPSLNALGTSPSILGVEDMFNRSSSKASTPAKTSSSFMQQSPDHAKPPSHAFADVKTSADATKDNKAQRQEAAAALKKDRLVTDIDVYTKAVNNIAEPSGRERRGAHGRRPFLKLRRHKLL